MGDDEDFADAVNARSRLMQGDEHGNPKLLARELQHSASQRSAQSLLGLSGESWEGGPREGEGVGWSRGGWVEGAWVIPDSARPILVGQAPTPRKL